MARTRRARGLIIAVAAAAVACASGCTRAEHDTPIVAWTLEPERPETGRPATARVWVRQRDGRPVSGARLQVEGHMSHPGMPPLVIAAVESSAGEYVAPLTFTMPGDWTLVLTGTRKDGTRLTATYDVTSVR